MRVGWRESHRHQQCIDRTLHVGSPAPTGAAELEQRLSKPDVSSLRGRTEGDGGAEARDRSLQDVITVFRFRLDA